MNTSREKRTRGGVSTLPPWKRPAAVVSVGKRVVVSPTTGKKAGRRQPRSEAALTGRGGNRRPGPAGDVDRRRPRVVVVAGVMNVAGEAQAAVDNLRVANPGRAGGAEDLLGVHHVLGRLDHLPLLEEKAGSGKRGWGRDAAEGGSLLNDVLREGLPAASRPRQSWSRRRGRRAPGLCVGSR